MSLLVDQLHDAHRPLDAKERREPPHRRGVDARNRRIQPDTARDRVAESRPRRQLVGVLDPRIGEALSDGPLEHDSILALNLSIDKGSTLVYNSCVPQRGGVMTIYSIRTSMGRELWWTTSRKRAVEVAEQLDEPGRYVHSNGCVGGFSKTEGLRDFDLPVAVYKCSQSKPALVPQEGVK